MSEAPHRLQRLRPRIARSLLGQVLLALAGALLLVQGFSAVLIYRARAERGEAELISSAAFRMIGAAQQPSGAGTPPPPERAGSIDRRRRYRPDANPVGELLGGNDWTGAGRSGGRGGGRGPRPIHSAQSPLRPGESRDGEAEMRLRRILADQGLAVNQVVVVRRKVGDDRASIDHIRARPWLRSSALADRGTVMVAAAQLGAHDWLVARVFVHEDGRGLIVTLLWQTLLIYLVMVGAIALILRRITRPLAALTTRLERFAETRSLDGQIAPEGPDDVRRLIVAHNAMEARIAALLDEKDVMLGAIGHDLKTPLSALRVRIESVEDDTERARMAMTIEDIARTLDDILSLARVGRPSDPLEHTELSALVASVVEEYEDIGEPAELGDTVRIALSLRPTWVRRALRNLIGNALRYGATARVSLARAGASAMVRIDDDGPGIPEHDIARMMDAFTRGEPSRNSETGGAGLGLALARAIADQHGGAITLRNRRRPDATIEGLTATFSLPIG